MQYSVVWNTETVPKGVEKRMHMTAVYSGLNSGGLVGGVEVKGEGVCGVCQGRS